MCLSDIKNANLSTEKRDLARATVPDLTYESMKKQIKAIYDQCSASENKKVESSRDEIQVAHRAERASNLTFSKCLHLVDLNIPRISMTRDKMAVTASIRA